MYIQSNNHDIPFTIPRGYSGSAFAPPENATQQHTPEQQEPLAEAPPPKEEPYEETTVKDIKEDAVPAFAPHREARRGGIFERLPFLSSLLPPTRKKQGEKEGLPEWVVIGIVLLLLLDSPENDLLPFLLILLLWD